MTPIDYSDARLVHGYFLIGYFFICRSEDQNLLIFHEVGNQILIVSLNFLKSIVSVF